MSDTLQPSRVTTLAELRETVLAAYRSAHVNGLAHGPGATVTCPLCDRPIAEEERVMWEDVSAGVITACHATCTIEGGRLEVERLRGLLRLMEWGRTDQCPVCGAERPDHYSCWLANEIRLLPGPEVGPAISIHLPAELLVRMDEMAGERGETRSATIRRLVASMVG